MLPVFPEIKPGTKKIEMAASMAGTATHKNSPVEEKFLSMQKNCRIKDIKTKLAEPTTRIFPYSLSLPSNMLVIIASLTGIRDL